MIKCLYYNRRDKQRELFMLSELTTLEATSLLDGFIRIQGVQILSYAGDEYLGEDIASRFGSVEDFNRFFIDNPQFYIHDCALHLGNDLVISSHDDGEVHIEQPVNFEERKLINDILRIKGLSEKLISEAIHHTGCYCSLDSEGNLAAVYKTFDDYWNSNS